MGDSSTMRWRSREPGEVLVATSLHEVELLEGRLDVTAALFEVGTAYADLFDQIVQLTGLAGLLVVHVHDRGDLVEREADPSPAQDQGEAHPVALVEDPGGAPTFRGEQAEVLVMSDRSRRDVVLRGERSDAEGAVLVTHGAPCVRSGYVLECLTSVSYTHLTLPTIYSV